MIAGYGFTEHVLPRMLPALVFVTLASLAWLVPLKTMRLGPLDSARRRRRGDPRGLGDDLAVRPAPPPLLPRRDHRHPDHLRGDAGRRPVAAARLRRRHHPPGRPRAGRPRVPRVLRRRLRGHLPRHHLRLRHPRAPRRQAGDHRPPQQRAGPRPGPACPALRHPVPLLHRRAVAADEPARLVAPRPGRRPLRRGHRPRRGRPPPRGDRPGRTGLQPAHADRRLRRHPTRRRHPRRPRPRGQPQRTPETQPAADARDPPARPGRGDRPRLVRLLRAARRDHRDPRDGRTVDRRGAA